MDWEDFQRTAVTQISRDELEAMGFRLDGMFPGLRKVEGSEFKRSDSA